MMGFIMFILAGIHWQLLLLSKRNETKRKTCRGLVNLPRKIAETVRGTAIVYDWLLLSCMLSSLCLCVCVCPISACAVSSPSLSVRALSVCYNIIYLTLRAQFFVRLFCFIWIYADNLTKNRERVGKRNLRQTMSNAARWVRTTFPPLNLLYRPTCCMINLPQEDDAGNALHHPAQHREHCAKCIKYLYLASCEAHTHTCTRYTYLWRNIWSKYWWPIRARGAWSRAGVEGGEVGVAKKVTNFRTFASNSFGWHQNVFSIYFTSPVAKKSRQQRVRWLWSCSTGSYSVISKRMKKS